MAKKNELKYTPEEIEKLVEQYFAECAENARKPTAAGLCVRLGITVKRFLSLLGGKDGDESVRALRMAQLRLIDDIEQRTDSMSVSRAKLPVYTLDRGGDAGGGVTVKVVLRGVGKGEKPFD